MYESTAKLIVRKTKYIFSIVHKVIADVIPRTSITNMHLTCFSYVIESSSETNIYNWVARLHLLERKNLSAKLFPEITG